MKIRLPKSDVLDIQHARRDTRKTFTDSLGYSEENRLLESRSCRQTEKDHEMGFRVVACARLNCLPIEASGGHFWEQIS
jgi:hypothetical protein